MRQPFNGQGHTSNFMNFAKEINKLHVVLQLYWVTNFYVRYYKAKPFISNKMHVQMYSAQRVKLLQSRDETHPLASWFSLAVYHFHLFGRAISRSMTPPFVTSCHWYKVFSDAWYKYYADNLVIWGLNVVIVKCIATIQSNLCDWSAKLATPKWSDKARNYWDKNQPAKLPDKYRTKERVPTFTKSVVIYIWITAVITKWQTRRKF